MKVYLEGRPDQALVQCLGINKRSITSEGPRTEVIKRVVKESKAIGIVDENPYVRQPGYLSHFVFNQRKHAVKTYRHQQNNNLLIMLCPNLEIWLLQITKAAKVDVATFHLPNTYKRLHDELTIGSKNLSKLDKLINHLLEKDNKPLHYLKSLLGEA